MPAAVSVLADLASDAPAAVKRAAANDLITHGRKQPKLDVTSPHMLDGQIQINLITFTESDYGKKVISGEVSTEVIDIVARSSGDDDIAEEPEDAVILNESPDPLLVRD